MAVVVIATLSANIVGAAYGDPVDVETDSLPATMGTINVHVPPQAGARAFITLEPNNLPQAGLPSPAAPTLGSTVSGALAATTYFVKTTYVSAIGETLGSAESTLAVALNSVLTVASPATYPDAAGYNVYVSVTTGIETKQNGGTPIAIGTAWTEPTTGLVAGAALPTSNTSGFSNGPCSVTISQGSGSLSTPVAQ
jgi:hypothetical protein